MGFVGFFSSGVVHRNGGEFPIKINVDSVTHFSMYATEIPISASLDSQGHFLEFLIV